jgi:putative lipoprotein
LDKVDFSLMFAGDIDGDGKLDLVFNLSGEFGELYVALYLSSCALPGQLVRKVSEVVDDFGC